MIDILAFLFASGVGFGLSCWIFGTLLDKSNNMGDYKGGNGDYNAYVNFTARRDKMDKSEYSSFIYMHGKRIDTGDAPKGTDLVRRLTPEELARYKKTVPTGEFSSERTGSPAKKVLLTSSKNGRLRTAGTVISRAYSSLSKRKTETEPDSDATFSRPYLYLRYQP